MEKIVRLQPSIVFTMKLWRRSHIQEGCDTYNTT